MATVPGQLIWEITKKEEQACELGSQVCDEEGIPSHGQGCYQSGTNMLDLQFVVLLMHMCFVECYE